jgi:LCP family protein required for cell wall assembly
MKLMNHETVTYTVNLIAMKNNNVDASSILGIVKASSDNTEGGTLAKELIDKKYKNYDSLEYDDYEPMINALYKGEIDAAFVPGNYKSIFGKDDMFPNIAEETKVVDEYSKDMKNEDNELLLHSSSKDLTEPFTMLVMGVDSDRDGLTANQAFNGDTLIMITFNPSTLTATMFSIPRDMYVPIACNGNRYNKINSSAAYGSSCVIKTVEQLTGIKIDYYLKMNFKGVVDLVNAVGGVDVNVEEPDFAYPGHTKQEVCEQDSKRRLGADLVCMNVGPQTLNGEQALAYSRCRHLYTLSDFARIQHQQDVVEAMANQMKSMKSVNDFYAVLEAISNNMVTNMSTAQLLSLYNVFKVAVIDGNNGSMINIQKTYLTGYNLNMIVSNISRTMPVYTYQYYESSLNEIKDALNVTLEKKKPTWTKTFDYSINETYEPVVIGKSYLSTSKNEALPNFVGKTLTEAKEWCEARNIKVTTVEVTESNSLYNKDYPNGTVITQSELKGTLTSTINNIIFGVNTESKTTTSSSSSSSKKNEVSSSSSSSSTSKATSPTQVPTPAIVEP